MMAAARHAMQAGPRVTVAKLMHAVLGCQPRAPVGKPPANGQDYIPQARAETASGPPAPRPSDRSAARRIVMMMMSFRVMTNNNAARRVMMHSEGRSKSRRGREWTCELRVCLRRAHPSSIARVDGWTKRRDRPSRRRRRDRDDRSSSPLQVVLRAQPVVSVITTSALRGPATARAFVIS